MSIKTTPNLTLKIPKINDRFLFGIQLKVSTKDKSVKNKLYLSPIIEGTSENKMLKSSQKTQAFQLESSNRSRIDIDNIKQVKVKFKPSFYSKYLMEALLPPEKIKKEKLKKAYRSLNNSYIDNKTNENTIIKDISFIDEREELNLVPVKKSRPFLKSLDNHSHSKCNHFNPEDRFINYFLTPVNKFINKDFKLDINEPGIKRPKRNILNISHVPKIPKLKR